ncbi:MAG: DrmB family protein [Sulfuricaulis sp.]
MVGKMGRSQSVTTFGVGSIYELRTFHGGKATLHSVMIAGLDAWKPFAMQMSVIHEAVLARILGVDYFLLPPSEAEQPYGDNPAIPAVRFPEVLYCDKCGRVGKTGREFTDPQMSGAKCAAQGCGGKAIPFRFVVACHDKKDRNQPGHIEDFPYVWWAHRGATRCSAPAVYLESKAKTTGLSSMVLKCRGCGAPGQSLEIIFQNGALAGLRCSGKRPWLQDSEPGCQRSLRVLQRGASNTYYSKPASALSIPPYSERLFTLVGRVLTTALCTALRSGRLQVSAAVDICRSTPGLDDPDVFSDVQIAEAIAVGAGTAEIVLPGSEAEQRHQERNAIVQGRQESDDAADFVAVPITDFGGYPLLSEYFDRIVLVHRLREVRALRGFQRVESTSGGDAYGVEVAPISRKKLNWLPAIEVRGEGIYIELKRERILAWQALDQVRSRYGILAANLARACSENGREELPPTAQEILIHTFAHLLMKQLSLECGYSGSSLRERLYVRDHDRGDGYAGVLIYTASSAADGTLGGLVGQGRPERIQAVMRAALQSARWCSSDPLCAESKGQGVDALNLSACHACALVAETSCEKRNLYLDRGLVVGVADSPASGFFSALLPSLD